MLHAVSKYLINKNTHLCGSDKLKWPTYKTELLHSKPLRPMT